jgi:hypothetical protein
MKALRYACYGIVAMMITGCSVNDYCSPSAPEPIDPGNNDGGEHEEPGDIPSNPGIKPTMPIKRRPIVPSQKLPRPRIVEIYLSDDSTLNITLASDAGIATITIVDHDNNTAQVYVTEDKHIEIENLPAGEFEVLVETHGEMESFLIIHN